MHPILPYFLLSAFFLCLGAGVARWWPFYREMLAHPPRYAAVEGLRGFLALGVFFHHAVIGYFAARTGVWGESPIRFYALTGHVGVSLFFMVTGFLFWEKALKNHGRFNLKELYRSRLFRLAPAYLLSVALVLLAVALPFEPYALEQLQPRDLYYVLMFKGLRSVNGLNGVYWTLVWEWRFYLLLPLASLSLRWKGGPVLVAALIVGYTVWRPSTLYIVNFIGGGMAAWLHLRYPALALRKPLYSIAGLLALATVFLLFDSGFGYLQSLLLFGFFLCVVYGNSLFGLLESAAARVIGTASYSLYLMHCIVLYVLISTFNLWQPVAALPFTCYWLLVAGMGSAALAVAWLSYRYVEHTFLAQKKSVKASP